MEYNSARGRTEFASSEKGEEARSESLITGKQKRGNWGRILFTGFQRSAFLTSDKQKVSGA